MTGEPAGKTAMAAAFQAMWRTLAPDRPAQAYAQAIEAFQQAYLVASRISNLHGTEIVGPERARTIPDNSAAFERLAFRYEGLEPVKEAVSRRAPLLFAAWHHGAIHHVCYGLARLFPELAVFARWTYQFGRVFSFPMQESGAATLVRMHRFLGDGRPVFVFVDGPAFGKTVRLPMFGLPGDFSIGPFHVARSVAGACIVPVTHRVGDGNAVEIAFHPALPERGSLADVTEGAAIESLLRLFERESRGRAPAQVLPQFLLHREALVRGAPEDRAIPS